jgi:excisionase family DNA binding protein
VTRDRISFTEIAARLGIARATARKLVREGTIPGGELLYRSAKSGRERWRISRTAVEEWLAQRLAVAN